MKVNGIHPKNGFSVEELAQIKQLADICNSYEHITLKLNWDMLRNRSENDTKDFMYYENGRLIAFLGVYIFGSHEAEISGMVHPEYRRRGLFSRLVQAAAEQCKSIGIPKLLFICQNGSASGKAFVEALQAKYSFSEYVMELHSENRSHLAELVSGIHLRQAVKEDIETVVRLNMSGFGMSEQDARKYTKKAMEERWNDITFIAESEGNPIGKISVQTDEEGAFVHGFCVSPEFRGQGFGRTILSKTIDALTNNGTKRPTIALEVATNNANALGLYESCGFTKVNANDYYELLTEKYKK